MTTKKTPKLLLGSAFKHLKQPIEISSAFCVIPVEFSQFPNEETRIRIMGDFENDSVFILNPTLSNDNLIELALLTDAAKRSGAKDVTAVTPWLGYSPQDKVFRVGEPLSSQVIIRMLESAGIDHFVTVDLHSPLLSDMFKVKLTNVSAQTIFIDSWKQIITNTSDWVAVSLDKGSVKRNKQLAEALDIEFVSFEKKRDRNNGSIEMSSGDISLNHKKALSFDDFTSTGGTLVKAAELIRSVGAEEFHCLVTHIVTPHVLEKVQGPLVNSLTTTNSTFLSEQAQGHKKIRVLDIWNYLLTRVL